MRLRVFNPEHDIALASFSPGFTSPHAGRQLRADLGFLPALWATEEDLVLVDDVEGAKERYRHIKDRPRHEANFITKAQLHEVSHEITQVLPWGWDPAIRHELLKEGVAEGLLPSEERMKAIREMSSREWAVHHLQTGTRIAASMRTLNEQVGFFGRCVLKSPWSSSGRGVRYVSAKEWEDSALRKWAEKVILSQGCIAVEPYYKKVKDFGMEFEALPDGRVVYRGLSLFHTERGAYTGNLLASEAQKERVLAQYVSPKELAQFRESIIREISLYIYNVYEGPFGVDMMIYSDGRELRVNPCVELNLRCTMGHVALSLSPGHEAAFRLMAVHYDGSHYHLRVKETMQGGIELEEKE